MAALSVSEQVVVNVYSILVMAVDIDTVCESDPLAEVNEPDIVQDEVVVVVVDELIIKVPVRVSDSVALK